MPPRKAAPRTARTEHAFETKPQNVIKGLSRRILHGDRGLSVSELTAIGDAITTLAPPPAPGTFALSEGLFQKLDEESTASLFTLLSLALRRSASSSVQGVDDAERTAYRKLRRPLATNLVLDICCGNFPQDSPRLRLLRHLWVRTQVLRCYAALLADAGQQVHQRPSRRNVEAADALLDEVSGHLYELSHRLCHVAALEPKNDQTDLDPVPPSDDAKFKALTIPEIINSCLLDSWASCWLRLLGSGEWSHRRAVATLSDFVDCMNNDVVGFQVLRPAMHASLGPLTYMLTAHVVELLSCCDGGTSYGLSSVLPGMPIWDVNRQPVQRGSSGGQAPSSRAGGGPRGGSIFLAVPVAHLLLDLWRKDCIAANFRVPAASRVAAAPDTLPGLDSYVAGAALLPPVNERATLDICIRLLSAAGGGAGARINTPPSTAPTAAAQQPRTTGMHVDPMLAGSVATMGLQIAVAVLARRLGSGGNAAAAVRPAGPRPADVKQVTALWMAYVGALHAAINSKNWSESKSSADMPWEPFGDAWLDFKMTVLPQLLPGNASGDGLPQGLGPDADAMVAAGATQVMERLVRQRCPAAAPLCASSHVWTELLMYGPMGQLAALIASLGKRVAAAIVQADPDRGRGGSMSNCWHCCKEERALGFGPRGSGLLEAIITGGLFLGVLTQRQAQRLLAPALRASAPPSAIDADAGGDGGGGDAAVLAGGRQLLTLSSFAVMKLLPQMAAALRAFNHEFNYECSCSLCEDALCEAMEAVLRCCMLPLGADVAATDAGAAAGGADAAPPAVAQWRRFLLQDVGLVALLRAVDELLDKLAESQPDGMDSCCAALRATRAWAARAFPAEMKAVEMALQGISPPKDTSSQPCAVGSGSIGAEGDAALAAALPSLDEVRRCVAPYCCSGPGCQEMRKASELALPQLRCGGACGGVMGWYCSRECQVAHWKAGHNVECLTAKEVAGAAAAVPAADGAAASGAL